MSVHGAWRVPSLRGGFLAAALSLAAMALGAFGAEYHLAARIADAPRQASDRLGLAYDGRTMVEVVAALDEGDPGAVPAVWPGYLLEKQDGGHRHSALSAGDGREVLPLGGVSNATTVMCREVGAYVTYKSDRHGFNNPDPVWDSRALDVVLVGDSFGQGQCVPPEAQAAHLLRTAFPATLNLAMGHNGPLLELASLVEYGGRQKPRVVIWLFYQGNDLIEDLPREAASPLLARYLEPGFTQGLESRQAEVDGLLRGYLTDAAAEMRVESIAARHRMESLVRLRTLRRALGVGRTRPQPDVPRFEAILGEASARISAWGGRAYFAYLPGWIEVMKPDETMASSRSAVVAAARRSGFAVIDLHAAMARAPDPGVFFYYPASHYSPDGQKLLAEAILSQLEADGVRPSPP